MEYHQIPGRARLQNTQLGFAMSFIMLLLIISVSGAYAADLSELEIFNVGYPRAFFFRKSEGFARTGRLAYDAWEQAFLPLNGIMGKVLDEEIPGTSLHNIEYFTRFKQNHPEKVVLVHFNGNARRPTYEMERYFAGHWVYYTGSRLTKALPASNGVSTIYVDDPARFALNVGSTGNYADHIGIAYIGADGKPDWSKSEQVELVAINQAAKSIQVRRGQFGSKPLDFPQGSYIAAHVVSGPYGGSLMWLYNYATLSPRDKAGSQAADVLVSELVEKLGPGGILQTLDGIQFDVLLSDRFGTSARGPDVDADGVADWGWINGVNIYGLGVQEFTRQLRIQLGDHKLIAADGFSAKHQRAFNLMNGIESEGWPTLYDTQLTDWSGGLNRHLFWAENSYPPAFNYINHKYIERGKEVEQQLTVPYSTSRLVLAASQFTDAIFTYSYQPTNANVPGAIWDELIKGTDNQPSWLGMPLGKAVHLATTTPDILAGTGRQLTEDFLQRLHGEGVNFSISADGSLQVVATDPDARQIMFTLDDIELPTPDLYLQMDVKSQPLVLYPGMGRLLEVSAESDIDIMGGRWNSGVVLEGQPEAVLAPINEVRFLTGVDIGGEKHQAIFAHPPTVKEFGSTGYTFWAKTLRVPANLPYLVFYTGVRPRPGESDGATFRVIVREPGKRDVNVFSSYQPTSAWQRRVIDLSSWAGHNIEVRFATDPGPNKNTISDHAVWGDVRLIKATTENRSVTNSSVESVMSAPNLMTWSNERWFTPTFYFRNSGPGRVQLHFTIEGSEPFYIRNIQVHSAPDAMVREFEHGVVLANPAPSAYQFDVQQLFPGATLRRIQGAPDQDPQANNGAVVNGNLTLPLMDALFLVKQ